MYARLFLLATQLLLRVALDTIRQLDFLAVKVGTYKTIQNLKESGQTALCKSAGLPAKTEATNREDLSLCASIFI